jgi:hypothetical protein
MSANDPQKTKPATLAEAAQQFQPVVKAGEMLEKHKDSVFLLRARGASYASIIQLLQSYGVIVSDLTLMRFCRQHDAAIRRIRTTDEGSAVETDTTETPVTGLPASTPPQAPSTATKMRTLRGKV